MLPMAWRDMPPMPPTPAPASPPEAANGHTSAQTPPAEGVWSAPKAPMKHNGDVPAQQSGVENVAVGADKEEQW
jgi:hypothetical protein